MPPDTAVISPLEWVNRARSNLAIASRPNTEGIYWEDLCFETQQAAEKALKAVLLARGIKFRYVHDLAELLTALDRDGLHLPDDIREAAVLTEYSVEARYPGPYEPVTEDEFRECLKIARTVVEWAETQI